MLSKAIQYITIKDKTNIFGKGGNYINVGGNTASNLGWLDFHITPDWDSTIPKDTVVPLFIQLACNTAYVGFFFTLSLIDEAGKVVFENQKTAVGERASLSVYTNIKYGHVYRLRVVPSGITKNSKYPAWMMPWMFGKTYISPMFNLNTSAKTGIFFNRIV